MNTMKSKLKTILIFVAIITIPINTFAQMASVSTTAPLFVPPSPTASSLALFADYPVSHYTGIPSINIPIYEIVVDDYKLPITLSYHSSGIRVAQEASWVGLGWALSAGGAISRTVKCVDDFAENGGFYTTSKGYYEGPEISNLTAHFSGDKLIVDSEPDIFSFNLPHASGKFIIDKSRGPVLLDNSLNLRIKVNKVGGFDYRFIITTPEGIQYIFDSKEKTDSHTRPAQLNSESNDNNLNIYQDFQQYTSSWYLSKIILQNKKEITFTYVSEDYSAPAQESCLKFNIIEFSGNFDGCRDQIPNSQSPTYSLSKHEVSTLRLTKITWDGGYVDFIGSSRLDMRDYLKYYSLQKLDQVKIYSNLAADPIKEFKFSYSYFDNPSSKYDYLYKRLKLDVVKEVGVGDYRMSYQDGYFLPKNSTNTDYWGYNNGKNYGKEHYSRLSHEGKIYSGAIKTSDIYFLMVGMLTQIDFPTGGHNKFYYEENTFENSILDSFIGFSINTGGGLRIKQIVSGGTNTAPKYRNFKYSGGIAITPQCLAYGDNFYCLPGGSRKYIVQTSQSTTPLTSLRGGNIVGYTTVEEWMTDEQNTQIIRYSFHNDGENNDYSPFVSPYINYYNGLPISITYLYMDNNTKREYQTKKILYEYTSETAAHVKAFRYKKYADIDPYAYTIEWVKKIYEITLTAPSAEGVSYLNDDPSSKYNMVEEKYFSYNQTNKQVDFIRTDYHDRLDIQRAFFPQDFTDAISQGMVKRHMTNIPIESISMRGTSVISGEKVAYKYESVADMYVPNIIYTLAPPSLLTLDNYRNYFVPKIYFDEYNSKGKALQIRTDVGNVVYLWGYNNQYPIAEIKNAAFSQVSKIISEATLEAIANKAEPTSSDWTLINNLRKNILLKDSYITTFKYKPLIGVAEVTDPNEQVMYYNYDANGRLNEAYFKEGGLKRILEQNEYKYAGQ